MPFPYEHFGYGYPLGQHTDTLASDFCLILLTLQWTQFPEPLLIAISSCHPVTMNCVSIKDEYVFKLYRTE